MVSPVNASRVGFGPTNDLTGVSPALTSNFYTTFEYFGPDFIWLPSQVSVNTR